MVQRSCIILEMIFRDSFRDVRNDFFLGRRDVERIFRDVRRSLKCYTRKK
jgi:hypothetical protein